MVENFFSAEDRKVILQAIVEAESTTSGEIRVHIQSESDQVLDDAATTFAVLGMHKTAQRNGVLFFLAVDSHKFAILGDAGINNAVENDFWEKIKEHMRTLFKAGEFTKGLQEGILLAGKALHTHFPYDKATDKNELSDEISFGK